MIYRFSLLTVVYRMYVTQSSKKRSVVIRDPVEPQPILALRILVYLLEGESHAQLLLTTLLPDTVKIVEQLSKCMVSWLMYSGEKLFLNPTPN